ncbi:MAG: hypothetical protein QW327_04375 [Candidatus Odinarchaeota archaeon]
MYEETAEKNQICNIKNAVEAIYIFDKAGTILASYNNNTVDVKLIEALKHNYHTSIKHRGINTLRFNCHKIWYANEGNIIFSMLTNSNIPDKVSKHILRLIKKPFLQGFKENLEIYYKQRKIIQSYEEILKGCCYPPFIEILVNELEERK